MKKWLILVKDTAILIICILMLCVIFSNPHVSLSNLTSCMCTGLLFITTAKLIRMYIKINELLLGICMRDLFRINDGIQQDVYDSRLAVEMRCWKRAPLLVLLLVILGFILLFFMYGCESLTNIAVASLIPIALLMRFIHIHGGRRIMQLGALRSISVLKESGLLAELSHTERVRLATDMDWLYYQ